MKLFKAFLLLLALVGSAIISASIPQPQAQEASKRTAAQDQEDYDDGDLADEVADEAADANCFEDIKEALAKYNAEYLKPQYDPLILQQINETIQDLVHVMSKWHDIFTESNTLLILASQYNNLALIRRLTQNTEFLSEINGNYLLHKNKSQKSALDYAQDNKNKEILDYLANIIRIQKQEILFNLEIELKNYFNNYGHRVGAPIQNEKLLEEHLGFIKKQIDLTVKIFSADRNLKEILYNQLVWAAKYNCPSAVKYLLEKNTPIDYPKEGKTPLEWAHNHKNKDIAALLTQKEQKAEKHLNRKRLKKSLTLWKNKLSCTQKLEGKAQDFSRKMISKKLNSSFSAWKKTTEIAIQEKQLHEKALKLNAQRSKKHLTESLRVWKKNAKESAYSKSLNDAAHRFSCKLALKKMNVQTIAIRTERKMQEELRAEAQRQDELDYQIWFKQRNSFPLTHAQRMRYEQLQRMNEQLQRRRSASQVWNVQSKSNASKIPSKLKADAKEFIPQSQLINGD